MKLNFEFNKPLKNREYLTIYISILEYLYTTNELDEFLWLRHFDNYEDATQLLYTYLTLTGEDSHKLKLDNFISLTWQSSWGQTDLWTVVLDNIYDNFSLIDEENKYYVIMDNYRDLPSVLSAEDHLSYKAVRDIIENHLTEIPLKKMFNSWVFNCLVYVFRHEWYEKEFIRDRLEECFEKRHINENYGVHTYLNHVYNRFGVSEEFASKFIINSEYIDWERVSYSRLKKDFIPKYIASIPVNRLAVMALDDYVKIGATTRLEILKEIIRRDPRDFDNIKKAYVGYNRKSFN